MSHSLNKTIWLLWLQGWENAFWLNKQVAESWQIHNPDWKIEYVTLENLSNYVNDVDYIYDSNKYISDQAISDIIRISLLKNHGGVWADATMLCLQSLDNWVEEAVGPSGLWMYHGTGADMDKQVGPASWFIVSLKEGYLITKWKEQCDIFWNNNDDTENYSWMDYLFRDLFEKDAKFRELWMKCPYLFCEEDGQSHCLAPYNRGFENNDPSIKYFLLHTPPYALKLWTKPWIEKFPDINSEDCKISNGYFAIQMSKRIRHVYKHAWK
jgi:hypothetical protein